MSSIFKTRDNVDGCGGSDTRHANTKNNGHLFNNIYRFPFNVHYVYEIYLFKILLEKPNENKYREEKRVHISYILYIYKIQFTSLMKTSGLSHSSVVQQFSKVGNDFVNKSVSLSFEQIYCIMMSLFYSRS